jgi:hypothetical protein
MASLTRVTKAKRRNKRRKIAANRQKKMAKSSRKANAKHGK